jgi:beta-mannosidase
MSRQNTQLISGWAFRQHQGPSTEWLPVEKVPTQVHMDLLANKKYGSIYDSQISKASLYG